MILDEALPHLPRLRRHARLLCGDAAAADDLLQDTLERAALKWRLWQPPEDDARGDALRNWLLTLMHRLFLNQRRRARAALYESLDEDEDGLPHPALQTPPPALDLRLDLQRAFAALPAVSREVLLLVCVEELSYAETARLLEVPVGTVMSRLSRARERLREQMQPGAAPTPRLRVVK